MAPIESHKLTSKYDLIDTRMGERWRIGKLEGAGIEGTLPIGVAVRRADAFDCEIRLKDRIERRVEPECPRVDPDIDSKRILPSD